MPELPEVETVRRTLENQILKKTIKSVKVYYDKMLENVDKTTFETVLINQQINKIDRYGKYLMFILDDYTIISHLRMEGKYFLKTKNDHLSKHEHIEFILDDDISFRYHDTRKFGKMALLKTTKKNEIMQYPALKKLGKEANDETFTKEELYEKLKDKSTPIKVALLDQEIICGLGNIYVDEVCFMSGLNPMMSCKKITITDAFNILEASKKVLEKAILAGGTTIRSYTSSLGVTGLFQLELLVHSLVNKPCPTCKTTIIKTRVGGRGTYLCPNCQRDRKPKVIGITGSIASGKTTVTNYLRKNGYYVVDADEIVTKIKQPTEEGYNELIKEFGRKILNSKDEIDNQKLTEFVFNDVKNREKINQILHPIVQKKIINEINNYLGKNIFISVPLLFEASFDNLCDEIIVIKINEDTEIKRLMKRNNITKEEAINRINTQMSQEEKCRKATYIIDNSFDLCYTIEQTNKIIERIGA